MRILFIGDIFGKPGRYVIEKHLKQFISEQQIDIVIVNGENAAGGLGITPTIAAEFFQNGVDVITTGNHIWSKKEIYDYLNKTTRLIRPANYSNSTPGTGVFIMQYNSVNIAIINLLGRVFLNEPLDCPFKKFDEIYELIKNQVNIIIVDFHAEATSEKYAFAYYTINRATAVLGTHTHIQTNDAQLLANRLAFISDVGMTGPADNSIIGVDKDIILKKFLTGLPQRFEVAKTQKAQLNAVIIEIDRQTNLAKSILPIKQIFDIK